MAGETRYITYTGGPQPEGHTCYVCTGTNDQTKINEALAWAAANPNNIIWILGSHRYNITGQIFIGSYTVWKGDSTAELFIPNGACGTGVSDCVFPDGKGVITQIAGTIPRTIEIYGFKINGNLQNQSKVLGYAHGKLSSTGSGVERLIQFKGNSTSSPVKDIHIHDMEFGDAWGEALMVTYGQNIRFHHNVCYNLQHEACYYKAVEGEGNTMHHNVVDAITSDGLRADSCRNVDIYENIVNSYDGPNQNGATLYGHQGIQVANNSSYTILTDNVNVYNNVITGPNLCGIWVNDAKRTAGKNAQRVKIYKNRFVNCGYTGWAYWASGIAAAWGNGLEIYNNTFEDCYCDTILIYDKITSLATSILVKNNNIYNTHGLKPNTSGNTNTIFGYGICNKVNTYITVNAENNYITGSEKGNYYGVTPISTSNSPITDTIPSSGTTDDDSIEDSGISDGIYVPATLSIVDDDYEEIERADDDYSAYLNKIPLNVVGYGGSGGKVIGESKSSTVDGSSLSDFKLKGSDLVLECVAFSSDELRKIMATFYRTGRSYIELGGPHKGYMVSGLGKNHSSKFSKAQGDVPEDFYNFTLYFKCEKHIMESIKKKTRGRYVYSSSQFSSDDISVGELVTNSSFESWEPNRNLTFRSLTPSVENIWDTVRYAKEINQFCAVGENADPDTGIDNVMISNDDTWHTPTGLANATNHASNFRAEVWCSDWMCWVLFTYGQSTVSGYGCLISDETGENWTAKATPTIAGGSSIDVHTHHWRFGLWIPLNIPYSNLLSADGFVLKSLDEYTMKSAEMVETLSNGRVIFFSDGDGETHKVIYSDDKCETWHLVNSADDTATWRAGDYSYDQKRIVVVAYSGQIMYSDDYGDTWTLATAPTQAWTGVKWVDSLSLWVACSYNGEKQIATSETGASWELQDTPYIGSDTENTGGTDVRTLSDQTLKDYNYTTIYTYLFKMFSFELPKLTNGNLYRLDNVHADLWVVNSGATGTMEVRYKIGSGPETVITSWEVTVTTPRQNKSFNTAIEINATDIVTITFYFKSTSSSLRVGSTNLGYSATEVTAAGSTITYTRPEITCLSWAKNIGVLLALSSVDYCYIFSSNGKSWSLGSNIPDHDWESLDYSNEKNKFISVSRNGNVAKCENFGTFKDIAPIGWTLGNYGQSRSELFASEGRYSLQIDGDGVEEEPGLTYQKIPFDSYYDSSVLFLLKCSGRVSGLTSGKFDTDIYAGGTIVKELIFDTDTDWIQKDIKFKFDTVPTSIYLRCRGANTPNEGAQFNIDNITITRSSDAEIERNGRDIYTSGYCDVIPNITLRGISTAQTSPSTSRTYTDTTDEETVFQTDDQNYGTAVYTVKLPALSGGSKYKIDSLFGSIKSSNSNAYTYMLITIQAPSLFSGKETNIALRTINDDEWFEYKYNLPYALESATNEEVTIKYYLKTSKSPYIAFCYKLGYTVTEVLDDVQAGSSAISIYNVRDPRRIMKCCNVLPQGYVAKFNSNYIGSYRYYETFEDSAYVNNAYSITGVIARNSETKTLLMSEGSAIIFPFDCMCPVIGAPFIKLFVVAGIPQFSIADASGTGGSPGTFYPIDANTSDSLTNAPLERELDNELHLHLRGKTKYYVKIEPLAGQSCEFGQLFEYASIDTMDVVRFYIYAGGMANTIAVNVGGSGKCSTIIELDYRDSDVLP